MGLKLVNMELDFKSVKALSSPTRVKILKHVMESEATPTRLSNKLDKSKSTISSHLEKLKDAQLVERNEKEGRKRVVYTPTRKADTIVKGKERRVKFTLASSVISVFTGLGLIGASLHDFMSLSSEKASEAPNAMMATQEVTEDAARESTNLIDFSPEILLFVGLGLLSISFIGILYGITIKKLSN